MLIVHNSYQLTGGEDVLVESERSMLVGAGHKVETLVVSNNEVQSTADKISVASNLVRGRSNITSEFRDTLSRFRPDVVHVHNFFPLLTNAVHSAARDAGFPIVQTLHNYRLFCAAGTFLRRGEICELCVSRSNIHAITNRCYRNSLVGSAAVALFQRIAVKGNGLVTDVDCFIALTNFARDKFIECGLPPERIAVKPNFVRSGPTVSVAQSTKPQVLYVGRLSKEKGVHVLVEAWREIPDFQLIIAGDGPERAALENMAMPNVHFLGHCNRAQVTELMQSSRLLVMPSLCYEGCPLSMLEAMAESLPVVASNIGALGEIIQSGVNGETFKPGDASDLIAVLRKILADPCHLDRLRSGARKAFERSYSEEVNLSQLEGIYEQQIRSVGSR